MAFTPHRKNQASYAMSNAFRPWRKCSGKGSYAYDLAKKEVDTFSSEKEIERLWEFRVSTSKKNFNPFAIVDTPIFPN